MKKNKEKEHKHCKILLNKKADLQKDSLLLLSTVRDIAMMQ